MPLHTATFRFYEELSDFLPPRKRKKSFEYAFRGTPSVKDAIEALGVPHVEVDLVLVNGVSVDFSHRLANADRVAVYPVFERLDITPLVRLRERPLRNPRFVADVHLGKLVRRLRILGFDCLYRNDYSDEQIARLSVDQARTVLTCDVGLLKRREVIRGRWVRARQPARQLREVLEAFDLYSLVKPFSRCSVCNAPVAPVEKAAILDQLNPRTARHFDSFYRCTECHRIYWKGSHYDRILATVVAKACRRGHYQGSAVPPDSCGKPTGPRS
jgi:uncharacterized protein with PIN domain